MSKPKVLNMQDHGVRKKVAHGKAVYVGRPTKWGNPFAIGSDRNRFEVIGMYRTYIASDQSLMHELETLRGKDLACWCAPAPCHADILLELANR
jgi:hypothetical protein